MSSEKSPETLLEKVWGLKIGLSLRICQYESCHPGVSKRPEMRGPTMCPNPPGLIERLHRAGPRVTSEGYAKAAI